jgi:hypothetical protein
MTMNSDRLHLSKKIDLEKPAKTLRLASAS